jgi:hypothetical protein
METKVVPTGTIPGPLPLKTRLLWFAGKKAWYSGRILMLKERSLHPIPEKTVPNPVWPIRLGKRTCRHQNQHKNI